MRGLGLGAAVAVVGGTGYRLVVTGALTVDTGLGRRVRRLRPLTVAIAARRETVFDVIAAPYLGRTSRAMAEHIDVLDRGTDMVLAAHRTPVMGGMVTTTVETVRFEHPETVTFRLVRGPVPHVVERFTLDDDSGSTRLTYEGELGTDFWRLGRWWGDLVARTWVSTVSNSVDRIRQEAERKEAASRKPRAHHRRPDGTEIT